MDLLSVAVIVGLFAGVYVGLDTMKRRRSRRTPTTEPPLDVAMLDIAMSAAELSRLRASFVTSEGDTSASARLTRLVRALGEAETGWTHVGVRSFALGPSSAAHERYSALVQEAKNRASLEVAPDLDSDGDYRGDRRVDEAARFALVTIVALSQGELPETPPASRASARALLTSLERASRTSLVAVETFWEPSDTGTGLSEHEVRKKAPRLVPISAD